MNSCIKQNKRMASVESTVKQENIKLININRDALYDLYELYYNLNQENGDKQKIKQIHQQIHDNFKLFDPAFIVSSYEEFDISKQELLNILEETNKQWNNVDISQIVTFLEEGNNDKELVERVAYIVLKNHAVDLEIVESLLNLIDNHYSKIIKECHFLNLDLVYKTIKKHGISASEFELFISLLNNNDLRTFVKFFSEEILSEEIFHKPFLKRVFKQKDPARIIRSYYDLFIVNVNSKFLNATIEIAAELKFKEFIVHLIPELDSNCSVDIIKAITKDNLIKLYEYSLNAGYLPNIEYLSKSPFLTSETSIIFKKIYNQRLKSPRYLRYDESEKLREKCNKKIASDEELFKQYLLDQKDYFFIDNVFSRFISILKLFDPQFVQKYKQIKNKTLIDMYKESVKKDFSFFLDSGFSRLSKNIGIYAVDMARFDLADAIIQKAQDFKAVCKYFIRLSIAAEIKHNNENIEMELLKKIILNPQIDIEDKTIQELIELWSLVGTFDDYTEEFIANFNNQLKIANPELTQDIINTDLFIKNKNIILDLYHNLESNSSIVLNPTIYNAIKQLYTDISMMKEQIAIVKYMRYAKPKNEKLFDLNLTFDNGIEFSVLKFLDPYAFKVGQDTNCCQRLGGAGEDAAIDSFINPLAGVLLCKYKNQLLTQSYFHYIPEDNGFILDNVEWNKENCANLQISQTILSDLYAIYAKKIKDKLNISYFRCGKGYNKLDENTFKTSKLETDNRHFEHDEQYSDFDEDDNLDLLKPTKQISEKVIDLTNIVAQEKVASFNYKLLYKFAINQFCKQAFHSNNVIKQSYAFNLYLRKTY